MTTSGDGSLRYQEGGNVHLDFHGAINTTIDFIVERFGVAAMDAIFASVGRDVYAGIRRDLLAGDTRQLVAHWRHFFDREGADYDIDIGEDAIVLTVRRCPAWHHVQSLVGRVSPHFCDQTIRTNEAMAEGSPYAVDTEITGPGACRQIIRRRS
ncbi:hypothetical protein OSH11_08505 [Kaistia dalseonensis]|uniref:Uncharacterized protein n=1 Tax=Kaistia dalseonensis TaxID=410840 RepID=A0ABU0H779_9HYPH|nr:hypothetical protein [Kaistia dalseonensis]MCX5494740.1 hypothetical protein [Kaistia dalseonensis]MDQ0437321.1 hypothetical protein [Kaistia dalseonensis]